ncbi:phasin family protein [Pseudaminobacter sp. NGMCC 1.201702]|uniref:phasin family protein n=1 Tax=Pseudaminobacter sp. NGMCC 1.201702 TaxID=3391825 RepID=UPI0039EE933F
MAKQPESDSFLDMFSKFGQDLKMPRMDVEAILAHHRKNLEALQKSFSASASGASAVMARQRAALQETLHDMAEMAQSYRAANAPREMMTRQADFAHRMFEAAVRNASEVSAIVSKSGNESIDILRQRIRESMEEIRRGYEDRK